MKTSFLVLCGVILFFIPSCDKTDKACSASPTGDTISIPYNKPVTLFESCNPEVQATITYINDSRCPLGGVCVTRGLAQVLLNIDNQFTIGLQEFMQKDTTYKGQKFSFRLVDVKPYPFTDAQGNMSTPREAILKITRQ